MAQSRLALASSLQSLPGVKYVPHFQNSPPEDSGSSTTARRTILKGALNASIGLLVSKARPGFAIEPTASWIDAHSHIWSRDVKSFPLAEGARISDLDPPSFTSAQLLETTAKHQVGRVVLIQHHIFHGYDNSYLCHAARLHPNSFRVVGMVNDLAPRPAAQMKELLSARVTGFRITSWIRKERWLHGAGMESMWRCAAETGQAICCLMDPPHLPSLDAMCLRHPKTRVVVDHFARIGVDGTIRERDIAQLVRLARHKNCYVKLSAFYALGKKKAPYTDLIPMIRKLLDSFGPERLMWASDSPYQLEKGHTYSDSLSLIKDHLNFLSDADRQWLLRKTAEQVYFF